ncbi:lytic transglycosylase domain-containing protein [Burkholderia multivorans]|uniref:lytic transglycosylase domain-containing protein n=1 Tax=Burkholderia multivorans TaxID=87883 RepID=UPI001B94558B|nr:transglycosylase SLT domain-containing protein [Burkholderia multivorans]MBR8019531.1 transglycosylase SLT domain-containing protein [Burkholderia multivorans]HEF4729999.1 transglycosylase SLT domain-containing protein [Burkholderia multivorans]HEF4734295.1 transglycosylase SLT domain-containing protein [Burkholderia multivorans]
MSDDLDKFVLQYSVDLRDSISRLEKLQEKQNAVQKAAKDSSGAFKTFASGAASEVGKLVPGLNGVSAAVRAMGAEFGVAAVAVGALAVGVKSVMDLREQYNKQRSEGMQLGVSGTRVENWQRQFNRASGGYVGRDAALDGIKQFAELTNSAYQDPTRVGTEARIARMLGVNVGERGANPTGLTERLTQLAAGLRGKSAADVQGIAKATGMSQDWLLTVQKLGPSIGKITDLTGDEVSARQKAEESLTKYNDSVSKLTAEYQRAETVLAQQLLPSFSRFVDLLTQIAALVPKAVKDLDGKPLLGTIEHKPVTPSKAPGLIGWARRMLGIGDPVSDESKKGDADAQKAKQAEQKAADKRDEAVDKMDDANKQGVQTANKMALAINMFSGAVHAFTAAIDDQQAWAAWAGEIGKANNLPGANAAALTGGGNGSWKSNQYADLIASSAKKYGVDPQMIAAIMHVESGGRNGQYSSTGAGGLMQITRGNWKAYGNGRDVMDPAANIDVGTRIYAENYRKFNGNAIAALNAYNGNSDPNYIAKINKAYGAGSGINGIAANSRAGMNVVSVQKAIASWLGVPVEQVQQGGVSRSDAAWAAQQMKAGIQNNIVGLQRQLSVAGLPAMTYAKLQTELRDQSRGLDLMRQYSQGVVDKQKVDSGRVRTRGELPITINAPITINGAADPHAVGQAVNDHLRDAMNELVVHYADGLKG